MKYYVLIAVVLSIGLVCLTGACRPSTTSGDADGGASDAAVSVRTFASIAPLAGFVQRVGGDRVSVESLVQTGQSPHSYQATARQAARLGGADLFFSLGLPFEHMLLKKLRQADSGVRVVDLREGLELLSADHQCSHDDHAGHACSDGELDLHVWMSPSAAIQMVRTIRDALVEVDPAGVGTYDENAQGFVSELETVRDEIAAQLSPYRGETFLVFHPAFGYFGREFGLEQQAIEIEGKSPSMRQLEQIIRQARADNVHVIFVQPQFPQDSADLVARQIGGTVVRIDPLSVDYLANLRDIADKLAADLARRGTAATQPQGLTTRDETEPVH